MRDCETSGLSRLLLLVFEYFATTLVMDISRKSFFTLAKKSYTSNEQFTSRVNRKKGCFVKPNGTLRKLSESSTTTIYMVR